MRQILLLSAIGLAAIATTSLARPRPHAHTIRWDLVQIVQCTALAGGAEVARDAATGDTFTLTGSGGAEPAEREATGGGTILHHFANGRPDSTGVYVVTGFHGWQPGGGQLPIADGIGEVD